MAYTFVTDATLTQKKALTQAQLRVNRDNDDHLKAFIDRIGLYDFIDTSDVSIASVTPTGTLWSSSQSVVIPTSGIIMLSPYLRIDNNAGTSRTYSIGLRIDGTDYFPDHDNNGTLIYSKTPSVPTTEYIVIKGGLGANQSLHNLDIEGHGISTGSQTVQPIIGTSASGATQTLKGATVTSRLKLFTLDMS